MSNWNTVLAPVLNGNTGESIKKFLKERRQQVNVYPEGKNIFRAFDLCPFDTVRVVILGQDPYYTPGTADGLAFSTKQTERPKSLEVIFKEIYKDLNIQYMHNITFEEYFPTNDLEKWAKNGFLLLNTALTVEEGKPGSHTNIGWDEVITAAINALNEKGHILYLLWGKEAQKYIPKIDVKNKNLYFKATHPAAELYNEEAGFLGCRHFSVLRDCLPGMEGRNLFPEYNLDACFDKEKAKQIVKECFPLEADHICDYIDKELLIRIPFNRDAYWKEVRNFEDMLSTKY